MIGIDTASLHVMLWPLALRLTVQEKASKFLLRTAPCVSTFCLPDVTTRDQISQETFPLRICVLQAIKKWERPGNQASKYTTVPNSPWGWGWPLSWDTTVYVLLGIHLVQMTSLRECLALVPWPLRL